MRNNCLVLLLLLISIKSFSHDPALFEQTWYLEKVVIDGDETFAVSNEEVNHIDLHFNELEGDDFVTNVCNALFGELESAGMDSFTFDFLSQTLIECDLQDNAMFEGIYFNFFFSTEQVFTYELSVDKDNAFLVITNNDGNQAFYGNQPPLSTETFLKWDISLFPSPAQNTLNIHLNNIQRAHISLYAINRTLIDDQLLETFDTVVDIKSLTKGAYFLVIQDENGKKQTKKFIKK